MTDADSAKPNIADNELSAILRDEKAQAIGVDHNDDKLQRERERALKYFKGDMSDIPALPNRSTAVDTTGADTIETILPDLMGIFTEEDVIEFEAVGDEDVDAARQETEFVRHVIFSENTGWKHFYTAFKDALQVKLGVWHWWAEIDEESDENTVQASSTGEAIAAVEHFEAQGADLSDYDLDEDAGVVTLTFVSETRELRVCFKAVAPEDVWFSDDGETIGDCTYVGMRSRERVQTLIADGYDEEKVGQLHTYKSTDDGIENARDTVDESDEGGDRGGMNGLRRVEVHAHYINTDLDGDGIKCWKVVTGTDCQPILDVEVVPSVPFSAITPFLNPHRLIGQSMMDKTMEVQKIKTSLLRMLLDSGYFALNQRMEVAEEASNENTVPDLLNNSPAVPIRVKRSGAVKPVSAGGLDFDATGALEYMATVNESRTGVIRNNMGLNPDALHDTATGQQSQENMGQRRTRMIARIFAETGVRDLCVGIHGLLRDTAFGPMRKRINGEMIEVDPSEWGARKDMAIDIGSGGKDAARNAVREVLDLLQTVVDMQGGLQGPIVDVTGVHRALSKYIDLLPVKGLSGLFIDAEQAQAMEAEQAAQPDPADAQAQAEMQAKAMETQNKAMIEQMKIKAKQEADIYRANVEQETSLQRALMEVQTNTNLPDLRPGGDAGR